MTAVVAARRFVLGGRVQGVGFRPFVYRLARREGLDGWVRNGAGQVEILAQGEAAALDRFAGALLREAPGLARPELLAAADAAADVTGGFAILASESATRPDIHVPPDQAPCPDCLRELQDRRDRRFGYAFLNCTQCGPRYTLIAAMPYDRPNTAMAGFPLCPACATEYGDPGDRRFHAEPVACPACGPQLRFGVQSGEAALDAAVAALRDGQVLAVKGIGGYHLMCDARGPAAIAALRRRKPRPHKPLAVMLPDAAMVADVAQADAAEMALLQSATRPIVLLRKRAARLPESLAPGVGELGVMLPYSPLHHLLLAGFGGPLVATSGNPSGEPVLTENDAAERRLAHVADGFLHHDRPIVRPADDPVYRRIAGALRPLRLGRGNAPLELTVGHRFPQPMLALGGQMKTTIALGWDDRVVISPHLGDMDTPRGVALLRSVAADLQALYGVQAVAICCDAHPGYAGSRLARGWGLPVRPVWHHLAHASALAAEHDEAGDWIVFTWDGTGLGPDGTIWGGEALVGAPGRWTRRGSLRPFRLPGGDKAARQPWRSALALAWEAGEDARSADGRDVALLRQAWERRINCPETSSAGRLFDAAAALLGLVTEASFEGQAPMYLETLAAEAEALPALAVRGGGAPPSDEASGPLPPALGPLFAAQAREGNGRVAASLPSLPLTRDPAGVWRADWAPLLTMLRDLGLAPAIRAARFHTALAATIVAQAQAIRAETGSSRIGLTGGVFQNRLLAETVIALAEPAGFTVALPERVPANDAGLSFGQLIEAAACR